MPRGQYYAKVTVRDDENFELHIGQNQCSAYHQAREAISNSFSSEQIANSAKLYLADTEEAHGHEHFPSSSYTQRGISGLNFSFIGDPIDINAAITVAKEKAPRKL